MPEFTEFLYPIALAAVYFIVLGIVNLKKSDSE